jgi:sulfur-oxidizing protein SoxA
VRAAASLLAVLFSIAAAAEIPLAERRSGYHFMGRETRAMQDDDATNPAVFWLLEGEALWKQKPAAAARACADCHGEARDSMKGVATRYPSFDKRSGRPLNLEQRVNACRTERQQAPPLAYESRELLALVAHVSRQSRGLPVAPDAEPRAAPFLEAGRASFHRRRGQLNLSCAQCHDANWGKSLGGATIPQGHPTGYPIYRLEWQGVGSLQRRLRSCLAGIRSESLPYGAAELVELELYLMWRARGMKLETPGVRP